MGKDKNSLGRALVKDRFGAAKGKRKVDNGSMLHTTEVQDGYEWGRLNLQSVTEESSFQEFLSTAELAGTEFQAEKLNLKLVSFGGLESVTTPESRVKAEKAHAESKHLLRVPRRPAWSKGMSADMLKENENLAFLNWRRDLAQLQDSELILTPYEKNLEFWRQLWRVLERSQLLVQVIDARNPLLFRCEDLEAYAKEVGVKDLLLLLNKADLLSEPQRIAWAEYFDKQGIKVAFYSAVLAAEKTKLENALRREQEELEEQKREFGSSSSEDEEEDSDKAAPDTEIKNAPEDNTSDTEYSLNTVQGLKESIEKLDISVDKTAEKLKNIQQKILDTVEKRPGCKVISDDVETGSEKVEEAITITKETNEETTETTPQKTVDSNKKSVKFAEDVKKSPEATELIPPQDSAAPLTGSSDVSNDSACAANEGSSSTIGWGQKNRPDVLTREELIELLQSASCAENGLFTVGMVGYPNVGKSSTINSLMTSKKVSVSATPGKTKHFQTLKLTEELMLCDCPGLVLPSFVCTKAEMVLHGILPIDQMREYMDAIALLVEGLGGRRSAEKRLAILLPQAPADHPDALPPRDLLLAYAYSRGLMTGAGTPDCARAARYILHSACQGRLPLAVPPPHMDADTFRKVSHPPLPDQEGEEHRREMTPQEKRATKTGANADDLDQAFFRGANRGAHAKGVAGKYGGLPTVRKMISSTTGEPIVSGKPWKEFNKHANKNKKQKLRKVYFELDKH